jgi:NitT/TauT family transport system substrate-binding protein
VIKNLCSTLLLFFILLFSSLAFAKSEILALNWKAEPQFGGFYAAEKYFKDSKIDLKIQEGGSGTPTIQMAASGQAQFAVISGDELIVSKARGATDLVALFAVYQTNPQAIMSHEEKGYKTLDDVLRSDGTLLWQQGLPYAQFMLKKYAPVRIKQAPYQGGLGAFQADKNISQQCFVTSEPLLAKKLGIKVKTFLVSESGFNPYTTVLVVRKTLLDGQKAYVESVVKAVRQGWQDYLKDPNETNKKMGQINKAMDADTFNLSAEAQKDLIQPKDLKVLGSMTKERWSELSKQLTDLKVIKAQVQTDALFLNL